ncbi:MAG: septum formation initiator family protein [Gemmatimonadaceae bacterium]
MRARLIWGVIILAALFFAVQGGEYSSMDILHQHKRIAALTSSSDSLAHVVDSLTRVEQLVRTDTATQLRIAREEFGLVRGDEVLYRFIPDTTDTVQP